MDTRLHILDFFQLALQCNVHCLVSYHILVDALCTYAYVQCVPYMGLETPVMLLVMFEIALSLYTHAHVQITHVTCKHTHTHTQRPLQNSNRAMIPML